VGADQSGICYEKATSGLDQEAALSGDPIVSFDTDLAYQCSIYMTYNELKSMCQGSE
jgi:hypothetical protein